MGGESGEVEKEGGGGEGERVAKRVVNLFISLLSCPKISYTTYKQKRHPYS